MSAETTPGTVQHRLGRNLRAWRNTRGLSQDTAAEVLGIHRTYLSGIERGRRNVRLGTVERMAARIGVPVVDLLAE